MNPSQIGLILLAAGESKRMGVPKQLLEYQGHSLIRHATEIAIASICRPIVVVLGAYGDRLKSEIDSLPVTICQNLDWQQGMSTSISVGIKRLTTTASKINGVIIALADQPLITAQVYNQLVERYQETQQKAIASIYSDTLGVPALFDRILFPQLLNIKAKGGAKQLLTKYSDRTLNLNVPEAAIDIDTPNDYQNLLSIRLYQ